MPIFGTRHHWPRSSIRIFLQRKGSHALSASYQVPYSFVNKINRFKRQRTSIYYKLCSNLKKKQNQFLCNERLQLGSEANQRWLPSVGLFALFRAFCRRPKCCDFGTISLVTTRCRFWPFSPSGFLCSDVIIWLAQTAAKWPKQYFPTCRRSKSSPFWHCSSKPKILFLYHKIYFSKKNYFIEENLFFQFWHF